MRHPPPRLSYLVWGLAAVFYLFGFFQRVTPASLAADLMRDFNLTAAGLGGPAFGHWSDRWQLRKRPFALGVAALVTGFGALAAFPAASLPLLIPLLLAASFGTSAMALSFGFVKESVPARLQGTATGVANAGVMLGTLIQMPVIGLILDAHWKGATVNGVRQYDQSAFQVALLFLFAWIVTSFVLLLLTRETHARQLP